MPTYEYVCDSCEHAFELFQSITAPAVRKCPECGERKVRRLIGPGAGLIFKGSGFYITDYRSEGYKNAAKGESGGAEKKPEAASGEAKSPAATDAKPKSESKPAAAKKRDSKKS